MWFWKSGSKRVWGKILWKVRIISVVQEKYENFIISYLDLQNYGKNNYNKTVDNLKKYNKTGWKINPEFGLLMSWVNLKLETMVTRVTSVS